MIDQDSGIFPPTLLQQWKLEAEKKPFDSDSLNSDPQAMRLFIQYRAIYESILLYTDEMRSQHLRKVATLDELLAPATSTDAIKLTFNTSKGSFTYSVVRHATVVELATAIAVTHFSSAPDTKIHLGDAHGNVYPLLMSAHELHIASGGSVLLFKAAGVVPMSAWSFNHSGLRKAIDKATRKRRTFAFARCKFYLFFLELMVFRTTVGRWIRSWLLATALRVLLYDLDRLAWACLEANVERDLVDRIIAIIETLPPAGRSNSLYDTMAWYLYRKGDLNNALHLALDSWGGWTYYNKTSWAKWGNSMILYHMYFIHRA